MEDKHLETLIQKYENTDDIPARILVKLEICRHLHMKQLYEEVRKHGTELLSLSDAIGDKVNSCAILNLMGQGHLVRGEGDAAIGYLAQARKIAEELQHHGLLGVICNNYARYEQIRGDFSRSLEWMLQTEKYFEMCDMPERLPIVYENIGSIYLILKKYDTAIEYFHRALNLLSDRDERFGVFEYFAEVYINLRDYKKADDYAKKAYKYYKSQNMISRLVFCSATMACIKLGCKQYNNAIKYAKEAITLATEYKFGMEHFKSLVVIAQSYWEMGEIDKAREHYERALEFESSCYDQAILLWFYEGFRNLNQILNNTEIAEIYNKKYIALQQKL